MTHQAAFDATVRALGFRTGAELAAALGRSKQSASYWRQNGFPKGRLVDLLRLARKRETDLPLEALLSGAPPREAA